MLDRAKIRAYQEAVVNREETEQSFKPVTYSFLFGSHYIQALDGRVALVSEEDYEVEELPAYIDSESHAVAYLDGMERSYVKGVVAGKLDKQKEIQKVLGLPFQE